MASMKDREKAFESKFAHDAEMNFKAEARRNRLLAGWVGDKLGMSDEEAKTYGAELIAADMKESGDDDVVDKIMADAKEKGVEMDRAEIKAKSSEYLTQTRAQLMDEA